jgi:hypothetical protein
MLRILYSRYWPWVAKLTPLVILLLYLAAVLLMAQRLTLANPYLRYALASVVIQSSTLFLVTVGLLTNKWIGVRLDIRRQRRADQIAEQMVEFALNHRSEEELPACAQLIRRGCNVRLRNALYHWSRVSMQNDPHSREHYHRLRAKGHSHGRAPTLPAFACPGGSSAELYKKLVTEGSGLAGILGSSGNASPRRSKSRQNWWNTVSISLAGCGLWIK